MKHVIILNGAPRAGKGTFAAMFGDAAEVGSIINGSKNIAGSLFGWDGVKGIKGRKLLSDLYHASMGYDKAPLKEILALVLLSHKEITIIDVRDPDVITAFKKVLGILDIKCTTVLIQRDDAEVKAVSEGLPVDCRTSEYKYDVVLYNNHTIDRFKGEVSACFSDLLPVLV